MDKILKAVDVSVWFDHKGGFRPSRCHMGSQILDLYVLQEIVEEDTIRYICKCDDDDDWEYSYKTFVFIKKDLRWYVSVQ